MPQRRTPARAAPHVRIVGGSLRGSRLEVANVDGLRPTPDRVRETLFNWLAPVIDGMRCVDLFAGTGALGIEALSRGAASCVLVERDARAAALLAANLQRLKIATAELVQADASAFLQRESQPFDLAFLDPPFAGDLWTPVADTLEAAGWLAPAAWIYVESPATLSPRLPGHWSLHREGRAGEVRHALFRRLR